MKRRRVVRGGRVEGRREVDKVREGVEGWRKEEAERWAREGGL